MRSPRVDAFAAALLSQRLAGGDLAGLLRRFAEGAAERDRVAEDARAATAQARFTGLLVVAMPSGGALFAELLQPGFLAKVLGAPASALLLRSPRRCSSPASSRSGASRGWPSERRRPSRRSPSWPRCAGGRELLAGRRATGGRLGIGLGDGGRAATAALRLGLPERIARAGLESRLPLPRSCWRSWPAPRSAASRRSRSRRPRRDASRCWSRSGCRRRASSSPTRCWSAARGCAAAACSARSPTPSTCSRSAPPRAAARRPGFAELAAGRQGPLADELRIDRRRALLRPAALPAALRSLRARVPGGEIAALCAAIERSRRYGSPLADQLRRQSSALRRDQRRAVEERAARAAPKIQLVVALVLVPSVLLMIAAALIANADVLLSGF